jgi:hypothetical protein
LEVLKIIRNIVRFSVRCLFALLATYWAVFLLYTAKNLFVGGPKAVARWYEHIDTHSIGTESATGTFILSIRPWDWKLFLERQVAIAALTAAVSGLVFRWRHKSDAYSSSDS